MAPKVRRPAASVPRVRPRRRPAAGGEEDLPVEKLYSWADLTLERLQGLDVIELDRASYYNASVHVAGRVRALHPAEGRMEFVLTGTLIRTRDGDVRRWRRPGGDGTPLQGRLRAAGNWVEAFPRQGVLGLCSLPKGVANEPL